LKFESSTNDKGKAFDEKTIRLVWKKKHLNSSASDQVGFDCCGSLMLYIYYKDRSSIYGWEIDHILAREQGGKSILENLQPLNWKNNVDKSTVQ